MYDTWFSCYSVWLMLSLLVHHLLCISKFLSLREILSPPQIISLVFKCILYFSYSTRGSVIRLQHMYYTLLSIASCFTCFILYYWEKSMGSLPSSMTRGVLVIVYGCCCSGLYVFFCVFCNFVCSREICVSLNFSDWEKSHHLLQVTREGLFFYEITWKC